MLVKAARWRANAFTGVETEERRMIVERIKGWWGFRDWLMGLAGLRRVGGVELPVGGRSSVDSTLANRISTQLSTFGATSPIIDFEMLRCLKYLWIFNPDLSQYVSNIINLGNTGRTDYRCGKT